MDVGEERFDKRLVLAQWAGDGQRVKALSSELSRRTPDVVVQENLFEARMTAAAAIALEDDGLAAAIVAVKKEQRLAADELQAQAGVAAVAADVGARVERKLKALQKQLAFKERLRGGHVEFFVERYREERGDGHIGARFWRIGSHPHGRELRSYLFTRDWVDPSRLAERCCSQEFPAHGVGARMVIIDACGERLMVHADSRLYCVARRLGRAQLLDVVQTLASRIDALWSVDA